ncbi:ribonuclease catalytic domain-containing protein [Propionivibrio limicola]|uniref:ribonuclease catalytic domain-containing protein n=1 Tax=Propionivibrio limicola TaxID=167645 RepID=UPI0012929064|nr:RNB domain-containing ribonuclease [Propionivibrio limicola]
MHVLFEEEGAFKTANVMADNDASLQVEMASGKRTKIKSSTVLLRFKEPSPGELLSQAETLANGIEAEFLWECAGDDEFLFSDLADDYFGGAGQKASAVEATALLLALQAAPVYFHRKGKGRFRKAPPDILAAALAGLEKKRQQALAIERMVGELKTFAMPSEFKPLLDQLLYAPDRNRPETKALEAACAETGLSAAHLLEKCGAIPSPYDYHLQRFLREQFPRGVAFPDVALPEAPSGLPRADVRAFSIDDAATTEIDDAFSLQALPGIGWRVGIHIAAPGLGIAPGSEFDEIARARLSTVYMPGNKITMLPDAAVANFTLAEGRDCPAVSLYLTVTPEFEITAHESRVEIVPIAANLRHHDIEPVFNEQTLADVLPEFPFRDELKTLWQLANACEGRRGKPSAMQGVNDYNFAIDGDLADPEQCRVEISERKRGSPLDKLVSELMIVANSTWGGLLAEKGIPAVYRAQVGGKVRMTTSPLPHEGLGVAQYAWSSSPLRRYVDLINQWQLIACLRGEAAPFKPKSDLLFAAMRDFELTYGAYATFQRHMERYWCLRWLGQEGLQTIDATIRRENLVKFDHLPLLQRVPSIPELKPGQRVRLSLESTDFLTLELGSRYLETLAEPEAPASDAELAEEDTMEVG